MGAPSGCENKSSGGNSAASWGKFVPFYPWALFFPIKVHRRQVQGHYYPGKLLLAFKKCDGRGILLVTMPKLPVFATVTGLDYRSTGLVALNAGKTCLSSYLKQFHPSTFLNFWQFTQRALGSVFSDREETWYLAAALRKRTATLWKGILGGTHLTDLKFLKPFIEFHNTTSWSMP